MKLSEIQWSISSRAGLLHDLITKDNGSPFILPKGSRAALPTDLLVGHPPGSSRTCSPVLRVRDETIDDLLAWLYSFAEDAMPVSTYCRIVSDADFLMLEDCEAEAPARLDHAATFPAIRRWASVIIGEIIDRSGIGVMPEVSASWALLSYSFTSAVAHLRYGHHTPSIKRITERLHSAHLDPETASSGPSLSLFSVVWSICHQMPIGVGDPIDAILLVLHKLGNAFREEPALLQDADEWILEMILELVRSPGVASGSLEKRLTAHDHFVEVVGSAERGSSLVKSFGIAAAAFLVGRGTSHVHLLASSKHSFAPVWFSLLAGVCGELYWDTRWLLINKRLESLLQFYVSDESLPPSMVDLSWAEYDWIRRGRGPIDFLRGLTKLVPSFITVELYPGVPFQIRVAKGQREPVAQSTKPEVEPPSNLVLAERLEEIARELRRGRTPQSVAAPLRNQQELPLDTPPKRNRNTRR